MMKKDTARFWKTILIAIAMLVVIDMTVGVVADRLMDKLPDFSGDFAKDNYRLHRLESDVVILGSSRGCNHYVTQQLSDSLDAYYGKHLSIYNAAIPGKSVNSNSCAAEVLISRYRPQLVIFDMFEFELSNDQGYDLEFSAPHYWKDSIVRRYLDNIGLKERLLMRSSLYRYNTKLVSIASSFLTPNAVDDGYKPKFGSQIDITKVKENAQKVSFKTRELKSSCLKNFENVLKKYLSENVPLVVVCSPRLLPKDNNKRLAALCDKYGIPFIDDCDTPYFNDHPELFFETNHLNDDGAHLFTALLFEQLKPFLPMQED